MRITIGYQKAVVLIASKRGLASKGKGLYESICFRCVEGHSQRLLAVKQTILDDWPQVRKTDLF